MRYVRKGTTLLWTGWVTPQLVDVVRSKLVTLHRHADDKTSQLPAPRTRVWLIRLPGGREIWSPQSKLTTGA